MMKLLRPALVAVLALVLLSGLQSAEKPKTYAVLVGVGEFGDQPIEARPTAEKDATALYDLITDREYLGAEKGDVRLLLVGEDKTRHSELATREAIVKALSSVTEKAAKNDLVIVGFFGRGAPAGERTCFFTKGSTVKDRVKDSLVAADIEQAIKHFKSERLICLIDIDYKGVTLDTKSAPEPDVSDFATAFAGNEDAEEHALPPGRICIVASGNVSRHLELGEHGVFAATVLDALKGKADTEGYEADGVVTVDELTKYLDTAVIEQARKLGKTNEEKEQVPFIWGTRSFHFALTRNPAVATKNETRIAKLATLGLAADAVEEGTRLIGRMPKLKAQQDLRREFVALADGTVTRDAFLEKRAKILKEMELDKDDAEAFARRATFGFDTIKRVYLKELDLGEMTAWAIDGMYRALEEPIPAELQAKLKEAPRKRRGELVELLVEARLGLHKREDLAKNKDVDAAMRGAIYHMGVVHHDPHSMYVSEEQIIQIQSRLLGQFTGIGVNVRRDMVRDGLLVISPIFGSPAHKAGVKTGDLITDIIRSIDAKGNPISPPEVTSTKGMKSDEAVKKIQGQANTKVKIRVQREGAAKPLEFEMARARIDVETVLGVKRKADDTWDYWLDPKSKIAYIRLSEFAPRSFEDMEDAMRNLRRNGLRGMILDLRFNPGGSLTGAVQISDFFIQDGLIVTIKPRSGVDDEVPYGAKLKRKAEDDFSNFPMVCLINGQSASASEIVSACLQDQQRATILGERSYGKGSVQTIIDFPQVNAKLKLTTATFWRPTGKNLHKASTSGKDTDEWGVTPDDGFIIPLSREENLTLADRLRDLEVIPNPALKKEPKAEFTDRQLEAAVKQVRRLLGDEAEPKKKAEATPASRRG